MKPNTAPPKNARFHDPDRFRLLPGDEVVKRGDFVEDDDQRLVPWEGPTGFQASSFVRPVYRPTDPAVDESAE